MRHTLIAVTAAILCAAASVNSADRPDPLQARTGAVQHGPVSWYGPGFAGRKTASGERFDPQELTMAHRTLPLGTKVRVVNPRNDRSVVVRVNDRGPYKGARIADLSRAAAERLDMVEDGVIEARLQIVALPTAGGQS